MKMKIVISIELSTLALRDASIVNAVLISVGFHDTDASIWHLQLEFFGMPNQSQNINVDSHMQIMDKLTHLCLAPHGLSNSAADVAKKSQNQVLFP